MIIWVFNWFSRHGFSLGFPGGSDSKASACNAGDPGSVPGLGKASGKGNIYPLQYSCLENSRTEEPDGLQSMGPQSIRHDWITNAD